MATGDETKPPSPNNPNQNPDSTDRDTGSTDENDKAHKSLTDQLIAEAKARKSLSDLEEEAYLRSKANFKLQEKISVLNQQGVKQELTRIEVLKRVAELEEKQSKNKRKGLDLIKEEQQELESLVKVLGAEEKAYLAKRKQIEMTRKVQAALKTGTEQLTGVQLDSLFTIKGITSGLIKMAVSLDKASVNLAKTTGYTQALRGNMVRLAKASDGLFLTVEHGAAVVGGLTTQFSLYAAQNKTIQGLVEDTTSIFMRLGVDVAETATAFDMLTRGMGLNIEAANSVILSFSQLSQEIGVPTAQLVKDFNALAPELARFGKRGDEVFRNLERRSRALGMSTSEMFNFSEIGDTFEGASDLAGKLNAQFGMQLNSMELMRAEGVDRVDLLRQEFQARGMNFEDLHKRQKQMMAEIMGTDVQTAARLFGDPVELQKYQREQLEASERAGKMIDLQEKFASAVQKVYLLAEPALSVMVGLFTKLVDLIGGGGPGVGLVAGLILLKLGFSAVALMTKKLLIFPITLAKTAMSAMKATMNMNSLAAATNRAAAAAQRLNMTGGGGGGGPGMPFMPMGPGGGPGPSTGNSRIGRGPRGPISGTRPRFTRTPKPPIRGGRGLKGILGMAAGMGSMALMSMGSMFGGGGGDTPSGGSPGKPNRMVDATKKLRQTQEAAMKVMKAKKLAAVAKAAEVAKLAKAAKFRALGKMGMKGALAGARGMGGLGAAAEMAIYKSMGMGWMESAGRTALSFGGAALGGTLATAGAAAAALPSGGTSALLIPAGAIAGGLGGAAMGDWMFGSPFESAASGNSGIVRKPLMTQDGGRLEMAKIQGVPLGPGNNQVIPGVRTEAMLVSDLKKITAKGVKEGMKSSSGGQKAQVTIPITVDLGPKLGGKFTTEVRREVELMFRTV